MTLERIDIASEPPTSVAAAGLIEELDAHLTPLYPSESRHGYSVDKLLREGVAFFVARVDTAPAGCGGVRLYDDYAEVKRMYVRPAYRGLGVAKRMLEHLTEVARQRDLKVLRLETGVYQLEAIGLYERAGFVTVGPFGAYREDPLSVFFEKRLA